MTKLKHQDKMVLIASYSLREAAATKPNMEYTKEEKELRVKYFKTVKIFVQHVNKYDTLEQVNDCCVSVIGRLGISKYLVEEYNLVGSREVCNA